MNFLDLYKHLLPRARAWRITLEKPLRWLFVGLVGLLERTREFIDLVYLDLFPGTTRQLDEWEASFGLPPTITDEQERRDRLAATWQAQGGQSPAYIQKTLRDAGFDVYVFDSWDPATSWPNGPAVYINPNAVLYDGSSGSRFVMGDGQANSQDGDSASQDGSTTQPAGYPLVNKLTVRGALGDGSLEMNDGGVFAQDGGITSQYTNRTYILPTDPDFYPHFFYIGGQTFPELATVPETRRDEFEDLCLKIDPAQLWLGMLITYV